MRRLVLFDVDGTLISTGGRAGKALGEALSETFSTTVSLDGYRFSGKTDPQIVRELMAASRVAPHVVDQRLNEAFALYLARLDTALGPGSVEVLPGVPALLAELAARSEVALGLLTGNIRPGAELKLRRAGLWEFFEIGAFGSDHEDRNQLVPVALGRARTRWGYAFTPQETTVLGDAEADIRCARAGGARSVAVASGTTSLADLAELAPDVLLESLESPRAWQALVKSSV